MGWSYIPDGSEDSSTDNNLSSFEDREKQIQHLESDIRGFTDMTAQNAIRRYVLPQSGYEVLQRDYEHLTHEIDRLQYDNQTTIKTVDRCYNMYIKMTNVSDMDTQVDEQ